MIVIKRFIDIITEHLNRPTNIKTEENVEVKKSVEINPNWLKWIGERFEDFLITVIIIIIFIIICSLNYLFLIQQHNEEILPYLDDFRNEFITSDTHKYIVKTFKMFAAFKKQNNNFNLFILIIRSANKNKTLNN